MQGVVTSLGGGYVPFSQSLPPTSTMISALPYTKNGICQALAAKWIVEHANGGSLWNWIFQRGTTRIETGAIGNLMINFAESVATSGPLANPTTRGKATGNLMYQDFVTDHYMRLYKLKRRTIIQDGIAGSAGATLAYGYGTKTGIQLARRCSPKYMVTARTDGAYVLISILGKGGGHAMAAFVGSDIAFFDPNFGEFYLPDGKKFEGFFKDFWRSSGYQSQFDSFYLLSYAKAI